MNKRILITGASGFIGKLLCEKLRDESVIVYQDRFDVSDIKASDTAVSSFDPDLIIHLASPTDVAACEKDPALAEASSVQGTESLLKFARKDCEFIFASTMMVYREPESGENVIDEKWPIAPITHYARAKFQGEKIVERWSGRKLILRIFPHTHSTQKSSRYLGRVLTQLKSSKEVVFNNQLRAQARDIGAAKDLVNGLVSLTTNSVEGTFNVGSGRARNLGTLARLMAQELKIQARFEGEAGVANSYHASSQKLFEKIGWKPSVDTDEDFIKYYLGATAL